MQFTVECTTTTSCERFFVFRLHPIEIIICNTSIANNNNENVFDSNRFLSPIHTIWCNTKFFLGIFDQSQFESMNNNRSPRRKHHNTIQWHFEHFRTWIQKFHLMNSLLAVANVVCMYFLLYIFFFTDRHFVCPLLQSNEIKIFGMIFN